MKNKALNAHAALIGGNLIFGLNFVISKGLMPRFFLPNDIVLYRIGGALILFWLYGLFFKTEKIDKKDFARLIVCGFFGVFLNQFMFFKGLNLTSPIDASIIQISNPVIILLFAHFIQREKLSYSKILGIALAGIGAFAIVLEGTSAASKGSSLTGNLFILINAISYALYIVLSKPLTAKYKPHTLMKWIFLFGFIFATPLFYKTTNVSNYANYSIEPWLSLFYVVFATTFLAYLFIISSMKNVSASVVGVYIYSQPLIAGITAYFLGMGNFSFVKISAALFIGFGVYLVSKTSRPKKPLISRKKQEINLQNSSK